MIPIKDNIPTQRLGFVTLGLIAANLVVYILAIQPGGSFISGPDAFELVKYGTIPYALTHSATHCGLLASGAVACHRHGVPGGDYIPAWGTIFTGMFMHASIIHLAGNMIFLWIFGNTVEDALGHIKYLGLYILGGIVALALQVAVGPHSTDPTLGAAGAIAAVIGGYFVLFPRAKVLAFVPVPLIVTVIEVPAWVILALWFIEQALFDAFGLTSPGSSGAMAYFAHVGGFAFGLLTIRLLMSKRKRASLPTPRPAH